jgi:hypothetical protein
MNGYGNDEKQQTEKSPCAGKNELIPLVQYSFLLSEILAFCFTGARPVWCNFFSIFFQHRASADLTISLELFFMSLERTIESVSTQAKTPANPRLLTLFPQPKTPA